MNDLTTQSNNLTALPEDNILSRSKVSEVFALILAVLFWFGVIFTVVWYAFSASHTFLQHCKPRIRAPEQNDLNLHAKGDSADVCSGV